MVHVTTTYAIKSLEDGLKSYTIALGHGDKVKTSWVEATIKGQKTPLPIAERAVYGDKYVATPFYMCDDADNRAARTSFTMSRSRKRSLSTRL